MTSYPQTLRPTFREEMDKLEPDAATISAELRVLGRLNRWTASAQALCETIERRIAPTRGDTLRLVDWGCGDGTISRTTRNLAERRGWRLEITGVDQIPQCLAECQRLDRDVSSHYRRGDIRDAALLMEGAESDIAHTSLVLHHLSDADVVRALRAVAQVTKRLIVWNDLLRERIGEFGARLTTLGAPSTVRRDAVTSVRKGFTLNEAEAFAEAAGLEAIEVQRWRGGRFILSARPNQNPSLTSGARPLLRASSVGFSWRGRTILAGTSMSIEAGAVAIIEGPNGCGKSTLLRMLSGAQSPTVGRVWRDQILGTPAYLPQQGGLLPNLTVGANISFFQRIARVSPLERARRLREALSRFGLRADDFRTVAQRSVGQARRAALASIFASASGVLLLDEPDAGLDAEGLAALTDAIIDHCRAGGCVGVATHHAEALERACREAGVSVTRTKPQ